MNVVNTKSTTHAIYSEAPVSKGKRLFHTSPTLSVGLGSDSKLPSVGNEERRDDEIRNLQQQVEMDEDFLLKTTKELTPRQGLFALLSPRL